MKKSLPVISGLLSAVCILGLFGCGDGDGWNGKDVWLSKEAAVPTTAYTLPENPNYGAGVAVHDPSIFRDPKDGKYYAFGTHFSVASSEDLITWKQEIGDGSSEATGQAMAQKLYGDNVNWRNILSQSVAHAGKNMPSTWAPDVEYIGGKYYMYYSLTSSFGSNKSVIGRVEADSVLGPYDNEQIIVKTDGKSNEPNAIDPELFYDKDGKLWMVYGSFYSGIYIKELNADGKEAGLPKEEGYGKMLWKGSSTGVEGPYVFYNASLDYYYLMVSDGSLSTDYNMRIARSQNPDGPYEDVSGKKVSESYGYGNKLAGNYQFSGDTRGYAALGHNSVVKKDGKYFVVYHTRYREGDNKVTGWHNLQVNQLFFNEEGWPVLSPNRYAGESAGIVTATQAAGDYDIVVHSTGNDIGFVNSVRYTLAADGKITKAGVESGSWSVKQDYYVEITLDSVVYKGVIAPAWINYKNKAGLCMTATSATGGALWVNGI